MSRGNALIAGVILIGVVGTLAAGLQALSPVSDQGAQVASVSVSSQSQLADPAVNFGEEQVECLPGYSYSIDEHNDINCKLETWCGKVPRKMTLKGDAVKVKGKEQDADCSGAASMKGKPVDKKDEQKCKQMRPEVGYAQCPDSEKVKGKCPTFKCTLDKGIDNKDVQKKADFLSEKKEAFDKAKEDYLANPSNVNKLKMDNAQKELADALGKSNISDDTLKAFKEEADLGVAEQKDALKEQVTELDRLKGIAGDACAAGSTLPSCLSAKQDVADQQKRVDAEKEKLKILEEQAKALTPADSTNNPDKTGVDKDGNPCKVGTAGCTEKTDKSGNPGTPGGAPPGGGTPGGDKGGGGGQPGGGGGQPKSPTFPQQQQTPQQQQNQCQYGQYQAVQQQNYSYCQNGAIYTYDSYSCQYKVAQYCQSRQCDGVGSSSNPFSYVMNPGGQSTQCAPVPNPNPNTPAPEPVAKLSCSPTSADVGMRVAITYSCDNSVSATASGFSLETDGNGTQKISGTASVTVQKPPSGTDTVTYGLTCTAQSGKTTTANPPCSVKINKPTIMIVSNPEKPKKGDSAVLAWVTPKDTMKECVISSDTLPDFTSANASNKSTSGTAKTPALTKTTKFKLHCITANDQPKDEFITVPVVDASGNEVN